MSPRAPGSEASAHVGRILIVEDEPVVARDIEATLLAHGHEIVGIVSSALAALAIARHVPLDLVLVDIELAGGDDGVALAEALPAPVLFVSGHTDADTLRRLRGVGARGFVAKPFTARQLVASVELALSGPPLAAPHLERAHRALAQIARALSDAGLAPADPGAAGPARRALPGLEALSRREREVLELLLDHRRPPQIAKALCISPHTVRNHLKSIFQKLDVHSQAELLEKLVGRAQ
ncbi:MAG: DNA-binding response regulator [Sandaracinaceae bacterium]|nr:DNA-binding response regulator [Sandaracinaceae bacterium]